jgi:hypothetical protein
MSKSNKTGVLGRLYKLFNHLHNHIQIVNNSKVFAGLVIIILNISSKFVTIKLSKTMESYLKNTFSKQILIFAIAWMGTRDIYVALIIVAVFTIFMEYLFNEESMFCILPKEFQDYHISLLDNNPVTEDDIRNANNVLKKAKEQEMNATGSGDTTTINFNKIADNSTMMR